jgi:NADPH-dependent 2,4-dienoyl-CoA reductase/sulfur reductase-like enzyme
MKEGFESIKRSVKSSETSILMNRAVDTALIKEIQPDLLVWATGAVQNIPKIKGLDHQHVITCIDYFRGEKKVKGPRVLVIGVGQVGVEITEKLGKEGFEVVAVEIIDQLGGAMEMITKKLALMRIEQLEKVTLTPQTTVKEFKADRVEVEKDGEILSLEPFQSVILASGMLSAPEPDDGIKKLIANIEIIGDARNVQDTFTAVHAGYELACKY